MLFFRDFAYVRIQTGAKQPQKKKGKQLVILAAIKSHPTQRKWTISEKRIPAIRSRVFPEFVCIEDVDKIISSVHYSGGRVCFMQPGKHLTASETRFTPIENSRFPVWTERVRLFHCTSLLNQVQPRNHPGPAAIPAPRGRPGALWLSLPSPSS